MTTALITGISGQDGWYLARYLSEFRMDIFGLSRSGVMPSDLPFVWPLPPTDLRDQQAVDRAVEMSQPDQVYHLAAQSSVADSWTDPAGTGEITGIGTVRVLEAVRRFRPSARVFLASSSEIFGGPELAPQSEETPILPSTPYGAAKAYALHVARVYQRQHEMFIATGILYNHESPRRPTSFVTRKITHGAVKIAQGIMKELPLGNLDAVRDWGFAGDYVQSMYAMLEYKEPAEWVIATGVAHTVRVWCDLAFGRLGLDYRDYVVSDPRYWRPAETVPMIGDPTKARTKLNWSPTISFEELVATIVDHEVASIGWSTDTT